MELSLSVYFFRWFLTVVVWQSTVWRTVYLSENSTITTEADNNTLSLASSSSPSQTTEATTFVPNTSSSQTTSLGTQRDNISTGSVTAFETSFSSPTENSTITTEADNNTSSLASSSSSSQTTAVTIFDPNTSSSQTSSLETPQSISSSSVTTFQTKTNQAQDPNTFPFHIIYIVVGVSGGILIIAIVIFDVVFLRTKRRKAKHTSMTEAASDEKLTETTSETGFHNYEVVDLQGNTLQPGISHSVDSPRTFQEKQAASRIQSLDVKQTILMENVAYKSYEDVLATLPDFRIQSTSVKKKLEDLDDASDDDGMMMFDNVAYKSLASLGPQNITSSTNRELTEQQGAPNTSTGSQILNQAKRNAEQR